MDVARSHKVDDGQSLTNYTDPDYLKLSLVSFYGFALYFCQVLPGFTFWCFVKFLPEDEEITNFVN